jgi:hypothetical protein
MLFGNAEFDLKELIAHIWVIIGYGLRLFTEWDAPTIGAGPDEPLSASELTGEEMTAISELVNTADLEGMPKSGPLSAFIIRAAITKAIGELWDMLKMFLEGIEVKEVTKDCDCDCCRCMLENIGPLATGISKLSTR